MKKIPNLTTEMIEIATKKGIMTVVYIQIIVMTNSMRKNMKMLDDSIHHPTKNTMTINLVKNTPNHLPARDHPLPHQVPGPSEVEPETTKSIDMKAENKENLTEKKANIMKKKKAKYPLLRKITETIPTLKRTEIHIDNLIKIDNMELRLKGTKKKREVRAIKRIQCLTKKKKLTRKKNLTRTKFKIIEREIEDNRIENNQNTMTESTKLTEGLQNTKIKSIENPIPKTHPERNIQMRENQDLTQNKSTNQVNIDQKTTIATTIKIKWTDIQKPTLPATQSNTLESSNDHKNITKIRNITDLHPNNDKIATSANTANTISLLTITNENNPAQKTIHDIKKNLVHTRMSQYKDKDHQLTEKSTHPKKIWTLKVTDDPLLTTFLTKKDTF